MQGLGRRGLLAAVVAAGVVLTSGCDGPAEPSEARTDSVGAATAEGSPESTSTQGSGTVAVVGEYETWIREAAREFGVTDFPEVAVVRVVEPLEQPALVSECLAEEGFLEGPSGGQTIPEDQRGAFGLAQYTCMARYPYDPRVYEPLTDSQVEFIRAYLVESAYPCLASLGYDLPEVPSAETFLGQWRDGRAPMPSAVLPALGVSEVEIDSALELCPENASYAEIWQH